MVADEDSLFDAPPMGEQERIVTYVHERVGELDGLSSEAASADGTSSQERIGHPLIFFLNR